MEMTLDPFQTKLEAGDEPAGELSAEDLTAHGRHMMRLFDVPGYEEAVVSFRRALEQNPGSVEASSLLAETYSYWGFREEIIGRRCQSFYDLSLEFAEQAMRLGTDHAESHRALSVALRRGAHADVKRSRTEILIALDIKNEDADAWYQCWRAFGYDIADTSIQRALAIDPELCGAYNDLGAVLCGKDRLTEALAHLQAGLKLNPRNALVQYNLAMVLERMGMADKGKALLLRARQLRPNDPLLEGGWARLGGDMS